MLTSLQVGQFRALGFLKLEGCLTSEEMADFEAAYERLIADAPAYDYFEDNIGAPSRGTRVQHGRGFGIAEGDSRQPFPGLRAGIARRVQATKRADCGRGCSSKTRPGRWRWRLSHSRLVSV